MSTISTSPPSEAPLSFATMKSRLGPKKDSKKLGLGLPTFERHPSASKLLNDLENKKEIETNLQKEISLSITTASPFKIILNESDNPLFDKTDVFYIKKSEGDTNPPQKKENKKNNHLSLNKNFFSLTPEQVQLDKEITESIQKGETFKSIKSKFKGLLVEKQ